MLYFDLICPIMETMDDAQAGLFVKAIVNYAKSGESPGDLDPACRTAFLVYKQRIDDDEESYAAFLEKQRKNGSKGGRPRKPKKPTGFFENPKNPWVSDEKNPKNPLVFDETKEEKEKVTQREKEEIYIPNISNNKVTTNKQDIYISNKQESSYKEDKEYISTREDIPDKESIEEKKKSIANAILKEKKKIDPFVAFADGDAELLDAFAGFEEMRKQIKKPLTTRAKNLAISTLQKYGNTKQEWIAILNQSTLNCWQGLFPVDRDNAGNKGKKFEYNNHFEEWESL